MIAADFLIRNTSEVLTCAGPAPRRGPAQADARSIPGAAVAAYDGRIVFIGFESLLPHEVTLTPGATIVDAGGGAVVPGFVDRTPTSSSPATGATSCAGGSPAPATRRSPARAAAS